MTRADVLRQELEWEPSVALKAIRSGRREELLRVVAEARLGS